MEERSTKQDERLFIVHRFICQEWHLEMAILILQSCQVNRIWRPSFDSVPIKTTGPHGLYLLTLHIKGRIQVGHDAIWIGIGIYFAISIQVSEKSFKVQTYSVLHLKFKCYYCYPPSQCHASLEIDRRFPTSILGPLTRVKKHQPDVSKKQNQGQKKIKTSILCLCHSYCSPVLKCLSLSKE